MNGTLELGHRGEPVEAAQNNINRFLRAIGDSNFLTVDGFYGEGTAGKVRWVQDYLKITVDGRYGAGTRSAITDRIAQLTNPPSPPAPCENPRQCDGQDGWSGSEDNSTWAGAPVNGTLELGHRGEPVEAAQNNINRFLRAIGDSSFLTVDGFYGEGTAGKVRWVQDYLKIAVDGRYGAGTRSAITDRIAQLTNPPSPPTPCENPRQCDADSGWSGSEDNSTWAGAPLRRTLKEGHEGDPVISAQTNINRLLIGIGDDQLLSVDGYFGEDTAKKLRWVQAYLGIAVDGKYGTETRDAITDRLGELSIAARPPAPKQTTGASIIEVSEEQMIEAGFGGTTIVGFCAGLNTSFILGGDGNTCFATDGETSVQYSTVAGTADLIPADPTDIKVSGTMYTGPMYSNATSLDQLAGFGTCQSVGLAVGAGGSVTECISDDYPWVWVRMPALVLGGGGGATTMKSWSTTPTETPYGTRTVTKVAVCSLTAGYLISPDVC